jgi:hypothetical protein
MSCFPVLGGHVFSHILDCIRNQVFDCKSYEEGLERLAYFFALPRWSGGTSFGVKDDCFRKPSTFTIAISAA